MSNKLLKTIAITAITFFSFNAFAVPVDVNTADAQTLADSLKGIGLKKAQAIIDYREANGNFSAAMELTSVKGIGEKTVLKNQEDIALTKEELVSKLAVQTPNQASEVKKSD